MSETKVIEPFRAGMCRHTAAAVELFKSGEPGQTKTREEIAKIIGREVAHATLGYGNVMSAIRHVERLFGRVWRWDKTEQVFRCLNSSQAVADAQQSLRRSGKFARKALLTSSTVKVEELTEEERGQYRATCIQAELTRLSVNGDIHKRLSAFNEVKTVDAKKLMSLFV